MNLGTIIFLATSHESFPQLRFPRFFCLPAGSFYFFFHTGREGSWKKRVGLSCGLSGICTVLYIMWVAKEHGA